MKRLENKIVIITGSSSGIGWESALLFAQQGAIVINVARRAERLQELEQRIKAEGNMCFSVVGDLCDPSTMQRALDLALQRFGRIDIAFNNAGILGALKPAHQISQTEWENTLNTNLSANFYAAQMQLNAMLQQKNGCILFTSTFVGHRIGFPNMAAYAASKAGLIGLTQVIAAEYGAFGIRCNCIIPGGTDTEMGRAAVDNEPARQHIQNLHALKRMAQPQEIAHAALFAVSDESSFMTGSTLYVDGGISVVRG